MIKSFSQFTTESTKKEVFFTFGRFNPPTVETEKLFDQLAAAAKGKPYRIYTSEAVDIKRNPLLHETKVKWMRRMFPKHARAIVEDRVDDAHAICSALYEQGFNRVTMVTSNDQKLFSETVLNRYNGEKLNESFYNFKNGVAVIGVEAQHLEEKMIAAAASNDLEAFHRGLPSGFEQVEELFNDVRRALGLKESKNFRKHIQLQPVSERREQYVAGELFELGDDVVIKESEEIGKIVQLGANYLVVESNGKKMRKWLNAVELLEKKDDWVQFSPTLHTLGIPRAQLPQVRGSDRAGLCEYLGRCGIESQMIQIDPKSLKPTQAEYSPTKVDQAAKFAGEDRPLLTSVDGHVLDGHHQWMAHLQNGKNPVKAIRFTSPIKQLITLSNAYMQGTEQMKESYVKPVPAPIVPRTPSLNGVPISKFRTFKRQS